MSIISAMLIRLARSSSQIHTKFSESKNHLLGYSLLHDVSGSKIKYSKSTRHNQQLVYGPLSSPWLMKVPLLRIQSPLPPSQNALTFTQFSPLQLHKFTTSATTTTNPLKPNPPTGEGLVYVEYPNPNNEVRNKSDKQKREKNVSEQRKVLPEELSKNVVVLTCESTAEGGTCDVHVVGTLHYTEESCREVEAVISFLKPQVVFLELCLSRAVYLNPQTLKNEFRVASEEALKYGGKVILGDRPYEITEQRIWGKMPLWHKIKSLYYLHFQKILFPNYKDPNILWKKTGDVDEMKLWMQEMGKEFPTVIETFVYERDQYMSSTLLRVASEHSSVVAVVGKGHLQGIKKHWKQPIVVEDLMAIPLQIPSPRMIITPLAVAVAFVGAVIF